MGILSPKYLQRVIRKNHRGSVIHRIVYLDTETKKQVEGPVEKHRMLLGWSCFVHTVPSRKKKTESWRFHESTFELCDYLNSLVPQRCVLYVLGHNIFFDLQVSDFFYYFTKWGWLLDFVYDEGKTFILIIHKDTRSIKIVSTTNYFDASLAEMGKVVGVPKKEIDFDTCTREELKEYCKGDVRILKIFMEKWFAFLKEHDMGKFSLTKSSQAFNAYRHRFMGRKIYVHADPVVAALEQEAYMGGRIECFRLGKIDGGPFLTLDVNSMFPYIMKTVPLPSKLIDYREDLTPEGLRDILGHLLAIAEVEVETEDPVYAVRHDGKIVFPVGSFKAFLCTPCLTEALARGHLLRVIRASFYKPDYLFPEYVDYFYGLKSRYRKEENAVYASISKYLLNTLYGKFGQYAPLSKSVVDLTYEGYWRQESVDFETGEKGITYKLFNTIVSVSGRKLGNNSLMAIPAHITEWARYILWTIMEQLGRDRVLYCDTDSIKIRKCDLDALKYPLDPEALGALKIEKENKELTILGPKSYITESERVIKGVPKTAKQIGEHLFEYMSFPGMATHMRERVLRYHIIEKVVKEALPNYDKGEVLGDGTTRPFRFYLS